MIAGASGAELYTRYSDAAVLAAAAAHHRADVAVAGTVQGPPKFFVGARTHAWHEAFDIVTEHGMHLRVIDNVDLAPRLPVGAGDTIAVKGQFVPTHHGGLIHDTHHCPGRGWHEGGWIEWRGVRYQ